MQLDFQLAAGNMHSSRVFYSTNVFFLFYHVSLKSWPSFSARFLIFKKVLFGSTAGFQPGFPYRIAFGKNYPLFESFHCLKLSLLTCFDYGVSFFVNLTTNGEKFTCQQLSQIVLDSIQTKLRLAQWIANFRLERAQQIKNMLIDLIIPVMNLTLRLPFRNGDMKRFKPSSNLIVNIFLS